MANKPKSQKPTDESMARMDEAWKIAEEAAETKYKTLVSDLQQKIKDTAFQIEFSTKIKASDSEESMARFLRVLFLRQAKDALKAQGKWTQFCQENGIDMRNADYEIGKLLEFRDELLLKFGSFVGYDLNKIKYLGGDDSQNLGVVINISQGTVTHKGQEIPFTPDEIQAIFERIGEATEAQLKEKDKQIEDKAAELRAKDRVLEDTHKVLEKAHRRLDKLTRLAEEQNLAPEQAAFLSRMETLRLMFDGSYMAHLDADAVKPDLLDEDGKPVVARMRAAYLATLWYFKMQIDYAYGQAEERYGDPDMLPETAWKQPTLEELKNLKKGRSPSMPFPSGGETKSIKS